MKKRIIVVRDARCGKLESDRRIAYVSGKHYIPRRKHYRDVETGEEFWTICGAIEFPAKDNKPGFGVIVGVKKDRENMEEPIFKVLDEFEQPTVPTLLRAGDSIRNLWGYPEIEQLALFFGDPERYQSIVGDFNRQRKHSLSLTYPSSDFQAPNRSEIFLERLRSFLSPNSSGRKRLVIGSCHRLRSHLQNLPKEVQKIHDYPAAASIGYCVHALEAQKSWMMSAGPANYIDYENYDKVAEDISRETSFWESGHRDFDLRDTC